MSRCNRLRYGGGGGRARRVDPGHRTFALTVGIRVTGNGLDQQDEGGGHADGQRRRLVRVHVVLVPPRCCSGADEN